MFIAFNHYAYACDNSDDVTVWKIGLFFFKIMEDGKTNRRFWKTKSQWSTESQPKATFITKLKQKEIQLRKRFSNFITNK